MRCNWWCVLCKCWLFWIAQTLNLNAFNSLALQCFQANLTSFNWTTFHTAVLVQVLTYWIRQTILSIEFNYIEKPCSVGVSVDILDCSNTSKHCSVDILGGVPAIHRIDCAAASSLKMHWNTVDCNVSILQTCNPIAFIGLIAQLPQNAPHCIGTQCIAMQQYAILCNAMCHSRHSK